MPKGDNLRKLTPDDILRAADLYMTPLPDGTWPSATALARQFGVTPPALLYHLRKSVPIRSLSETHRGKQAKKPKDRGERPLCKCGCGQPVSSYDRGRKRWRPYAPGHYYQVVIHSYDRAPRDVHGQEAVSLRIRERDGHRCRLCGSPDRPHVHHIDGDHTHTSDENQITLCSPCHNLAHSTPSLADRLRELALTPLT